MVERTKGLERKPPQDTFQRFALPGPHPEKHPAHEIYLELSEPTVSVTHKIKTLEEKHLVPGDLKGFTQELNKIAQNVATYDGGTNKQITTDLIAQVQDHYSKQQESFQSLQNPSLHLSTQTHEAFGQAKKSSSQKERDNLAREVAGEDKFSPASALAFHDPLQGMRAADYIQEQKDIYAQQKKCAQALEKADQTKEEMEETNLKWLVLRQKELENVMKRSIEKINALFKLQKKSGVDPSINASMESLIHLAQESRDEILLLRKSSRQLDFDIRGFLGVQRELELPPNQQSHTLDATLNRLANLQFLAERGKLHEIHIGILEKSLQQSPTAVLLASAQKAIQQAQSFQQKLKENQVFAVPDKKNWKIREQQQARLIEWLFADKKQQQEKMQEYGQILGAQKSLVSTQSDLQAPQKAIEVRLSEISNLKAFSDEIAFEHKNLKETEILLKEELQNSQPYINLAERKEDVCFIRFINDRKRRLANEIINATDKKRKKYLKEISNQLDSLFDHYLAKLERRATEKAPLPQPSWADTLISSLLSSLSTVSGIIQGGASLTSLLLSSGSKSPSQFLPLLKKFYDQQPILRGYETMESLLVERQMAESGSTFEEAYDKLLKALSSVRQKNFIPELSFQNLFGAGLWIYDHPLIIQKMVGTFSKVHSLLKNKSLLDEVTEQATLEQQVKDFLGGSAIHSGNGPTQSELLALFQLLQHLPKIVSIINSIKEGSGPGNAIRKYAPLIGEVIGGGIGKFGGQLAGDMIAFPVDIGMGNARAEISAYLTELALTPAQEGGATFAQVVNAKDKSNTPIEVMQNIFFDELKSHGMGVLRDLRWHYNKLQPEGLSVLGKMQLGLRALGRTVAERINWTALQTRLQTWWTHTNGWEIAARIVRIGVIVGVIVASQGLALPLIGGISALGGLGLWGGIGLAGGAYLLSGGMMSLVFKNMYDKMWAEKRAILAQSQQMDDSQFEKALAFLERARRKMNLLQNA